MTARPWVWSAALALLLTAQAPPPSATPPDGVVRLAGAHACRTLAGATLRINGVRDGNTVALKREVHPSSGAAYTLEDRYQFDPATSTWKVSLAPGTRLAFTGSAPAWNGSSWTVDGRDAVGAAVRMTDELLPDGDVRVTFAHSNNGGWLPFDVERCTSGDAPPPESACVAEQFPAATLFAAEPDISTLPPRGPRGTVLVLVRLGPDSQIRDVKVQRSDAEALNPVALDAAKRSVFRTETRQCHPIAADFLFAVTIGY